jgi:hypothetical protein
MSSAAATAARATTDVTARPAESKLWFWAGLAFVAVAFALLELLDPYFFCQDDALALELPGVLMTCRGIWQGLAAEYNPYTFLGSPTPAIGGVYPPLYLAYGVARHLLGDEHATLDVFAAIHLLAGYGLTFLVARRLGIGPVLAVLTSVTFVLSGPVLVMARCWHSFSVLPAFIPLFALLIDCLRSGPVTWRWPVITGACLGLYYHAGFPQLFVLGCGLMLVHAVALAAVGLVPRRRLVWLLPALAFGAAISIPVFYQQWRLSREISLNDAGGGDGVGVNILSMLLPYPLVQGTLPNMWGSLNLQWNGHFYYFGSILLVAFLAAVAVLAWRRIGGRSHVANTGDSARLQWALVIPAVVAFLLALGELGGLWWLMGLLPVGLRNNPFRAMPWFVFFACLAGARFLEDLLDDPRLYGLHSGRPTPERRSRLLFAIAGVGLVLVALHLTRVGIAFYTYGFRPYPQLPTELAKVVGPDDGGRQQRIMSLAAMRSTDPSYPLSLPHNLPCEYEVPALFGYDPLVQRFGRYNACLERIFRDPPAGLAAYGVRWLVVHRTVWGGWEPQTPNRFERVLPFTDLLNTKLGSNPQPPLGDLAEYVKVIEIPDASPLAFDTASPTDALPLRMSVAGLDIDLEPVAEPRTIVANFLWYPDIVATSDGEPAVVTQDNWQRIVVAAKAGARQIRIRYAPPRAAGITIAVVLAMLGAAATLACQPKSS